MTDHALLCLIAALLSLATPVYLYEAWRRWDGSRRDVRRQEEERWKL